MNERTTPRGFTIVEFVDTYNIPCSLQESSSAEQPKIWFGTEPRKMTVFENGMGKYVEIDIPSNFRIDSRMHLNQEQVAELIPKLQKFVETGGL